MAQSGQKEKSIRVVKKDRLEVRIAADQKRLIQRAADISGRSLSDFVVACLQEASLKTNEQLEKIRASEHDSIVFTEALLNPPKPDERLRAAFSRHEEMLGE